LETDQAERLAAASPIVAVAIEEAVEKQKPARRPLPEHLPREEVHHPAACACPHCGGALRRISEEVTETLDYVPGRFKRCYGASGEDKASSSLETTDGVPHAAAE
jgi:transposase